MLDHNAVKTAMRTRLLAIVVCGTGVMDLRATATGFARQAGSFITDGFAPGMELVPAGFADNAVAVVQRVTALELFTAASRTAQAIGPNRSLTVGLPLVRVWENLEARDGNVPTDQGAIPGRPFMDEQYVRGPVVQQTIGSKGRLLGTPMYLPRINVPNGTGDQAASKYVDAILAAFPPTDVIAIAGGSIHIGGNPAPFAGQLLKNGNEHHGVLCSIPLRAYSLNTI